MPRKSTAKKKSPSATKQTKKKAWVVAVDMGYGHQRAAYPLKHLAHKQILNANKYVGIPQKDRKIWEDGRSLYEKISRMKRLPLVGSAIFGVMDYMQRIEPFYPKRDLSKPSAQLKQIYWLMKKGWGKHLIEMLNKDSRPLICTFFTPAYFAEFHGYRGEIFSLTTDADVSRAWAPLVPKTSRIKYLVPNIRVAERMQLYGIKKENIFLTGFPLPTENIGSVSGEIMKKDLGKRLCNLDPRGIFHRKYEHSLHYYLGQGFCPSSAGRVTTLTFAVGGAGAQRELGREILMSMKKLIQRGIIRLNLVAGTRKEVENYFHDAVVEAGLKPQLGTGVKIISHPKKYTYFAQFNRVLRTTDILWTKPSELVFYTALGLPIIMSSPIGSQEHFNREWLQSLGSGIHQLEARYTHEWLVDWIHSGWIAEAAFNGFLDASAMGTYNIESVVLHGKRSEVHEVHLW